MITISEACAGSSFGMGALVLTSFKHVLSENQRYLHPTELLKDSTYKLILVGQVTRSFKEFVSENTLLAPVMNTVMY